MDKSSAYSVRYDCSRTSVGESEPPGIERKQPIQSTLSLYSLPWINVTCWNREKAAYTVVSPIHSVVFGDQNYLLRSENLPAWLLLQRSAQDEYERNLCQSRCPTPDSPPLVTEQPEVPPGLHLKIAMESNSERWWTEGTVAVVTGANKGLGFQTVKKIAEKGITVVLTARDVERGEAAAKQLVEQGLPVVYHQLDVTSVESAERLASWLRQQYGFVDILINNAGSISADPEDAAAVCDVNYYGVKNVTKAILPLLRASEAGARILNVSSRSGLLKMLRKQSAKDTLGNEEQLSEETIDQVIQEYLAAVKEQKESEWADPFEPTYRISKACVTAYTRLVAKNLAGRPAGQKIFVNCMCPGAALTDLMTGYFNAVKEAETARLKGAVVPAADVGAGYLVGLALSPANLLSQAGVFWGPTGEIEF